MNRIGRWFLALGVVSMATAFFFVIVGVFGVPISLAGMLLFIALTLAMSSRAQLTEPPR